MHSYGNNVALYNGEEIIEVYGSIMLDTLPDREHDLIRMLYGIGMNAVPPTTIADMFGVGRERIRQMKESALGRLKKKFSKQLKGLI